MNRPELTHLALSLVVGVGLGLFAGANLVTNSPKADLKLIRSSISEECNKIHEQIRDLQSDLLIFKLDTAGEDLEEVQPEIDQMEKEIAILFNQLKECVKKYETTPPTASPKGKSRSSSSPFTGKLD